MEFGKVEKEQLDKIDFTLPPDPISNKDVLNGTRGQTRFYVGMSKWGRKDWIGKVYPPGTKDKEFLGYYAKMYNSIEFNAVGYNLPTIEQVLLWKSKATPGFLFCPKFTNAITHIKRLRNVEKDLRGYIDVMSAFGEHLGPIFLLPSPQMGLKDAHTILDFISSLPKDLKVFLELRGPDWYTPGGYNKDMTAFLKKEQRGTVIVDTAGRRDVAHMHLTTKEVFIRFVGNSLHPTDYKRIDDWVERIDSWMDGGLETVYFFVHQHQELDSPILVQYLLQRLNEKCGASLHIPPTKFP